VPLVRSSTSERPCIADTNCAHWETLHFDRSGVVILGYADETAAKEGTSLAKRLNDLHDEVLHQDTSRNILQIRPRAVALVQSNGLADRATST